MKKVSVVMLSYNRKQDVAEGIGELLSQDYNCMEIIIVDNASCDGTANMVKEQFPQVKCIALPDNIGVAAYNIGFLEAVGEYIVILDDDSFPGPNSIKRMVEEFEKDKMLGVIAFDVRHYEEYKRHKLNQSVPKEKHRPNTYCRYQMAFNGCGVGIRKSVLDRVGGYPEEFFLYWNEQDLAIRILNTGYAIRWFTDIISYHKYSPTNRESQRGPFYYTRNLYWLIWKYFYPKKLIMDTARMVFYSFFYTFEQGTLVYLKATLAAVLNVKKIKRYPIRKNIIKELRLTYKLAFIYYK